MFVFSLKTSKRRLIPVLLGTAVVLAMAIALVCFPASRTMATSTAPGDSDEACATYLKSLGFTAVLPAHTVKEIRLPDSFDESLASYNALQQEAGFDLTAYAGQRVKLRTYALSDHPSGTGAYAHLYVHDGIIIGGDIADATGAMTALCKKTAAVC